MFDSSDASCNSSSNSWVLLIWSSSALYLPLADWPWFLMTQVKDTVEESIYKLNKSRNTSSFISGNRKNQDQPCLTLRDVESLFRVVPVATAEDQTPSGSMRDLPPSVAAAIAAEKRLMDAQK